MVVTRKGTPHHPTVPPDAKYMKDMHFRLGLLILIGQNQELYQMTILLSLAAVLQENTLLKISSSGDLSHKNVEALSLM
jgi:hypothetical protein